jgi:hypothetical protein
MSKNEKLDKESKSNEIFQNAFYITDITDPSILESCLSI